MFSYTIKCDSKGGNIRTDRRKLVCNLMKTNGKKCTPVSIFPQNLSKKPIEICERIHITRWPASTGINFAQLHFFDHLLQAVKNKTTVLILVCKEFSQTSFRPLISALYAKMVSRFSVEFFCLTVPKTFAEEPFWYRKVLGIREGAGITIFCQNCFVSQYRKIS